MELKQLRSFAAVVRYGSFTRAAENTYLSQPTISTHIRALEEELNTQLLLRDTKNLQVTPRGQELYECACRMLELQDNLLQRWRQSDQHIIQLGASTIPSAYILPEVLPRYGKQNPGSYFVVHQSDSRQVIQGVAEGLFDVGMSGMPCQDEAIRCEPFFRDRMVLIYILRIFLPFLLYQNMYLMLPYIFLFVFHSLLIFQLILSFLFCY